MADILLEVHIVTTPDKVYEAITTQKGLKSWWGAKTNAEPKIGAVDEFDFGGFVWKFRVEKLEPLRRVVWSSIDVPPEWEDTHMTFEITSKGDVVTLQFSHTGFKSTGGMFRFTNYAWAQFLRSIKLFLETGRGEPYGSRASRLAGTT